MARKFSEDQLVIASHNAGKVREMIALMAPFGVAIQTAEALGLAEPEEIGTTFRANAELKARASASGATLPAFADDSGLVVKALDGNPGIYSARWAGETRDFTIAMNLVKEALEKSDPPAEGAEAYFISALCLCWPDGHVENFEGKVHGTLSFPPRGNNGFGYDPIFVPSGHQITFGEILTSEKDALSHRTRAFEKLVAACFSGDD
jgi:XTP/dITP diphosphohydrolase